MNKGELEFKTKDSNFIIATSQEVTPEELQRRITGLELQKDNFKMQLGFFAEEIKTKEKMIEDKKKDIEMIEADIEKAYHFFKSIHREDIVAKIQADVEKQKKIFEEQAKKAQSGQME